MKKVYINYIIDMGIFLSFIFTVVSGIVKWPGIIIKFGFNYKDFPMSYFTIIHDWAGLAMAFLSIIHVMLHWKWMMCVTKNLIRRRKNEKKITTVDYIPDKCSWNSGCGETE